MTPQELKNEIELLKKENTELKTMFADLLNVSSIPYEHEEAMRIRLNINSFLQGVIGSKTAASETRAVDEGGSGVYNVAQPMDGFIEIGINGTTYNIPYYS